MSLQELQRDSLGKKHQNYNSLLKMTLARKETLQPISSDGNDIENLLKIDVACSTKNVVYIFDVLKSNDMLYVSRAIKQSTWLISDKQYSSFINVQYLSTQLFPHMMTKAINKLMHKIRLHLRDHERIEEFYKYEKEKDENNALKWLEYCSLHFVEEVVKNITCIIPVETFKRLCKKSITILKLYIVNKNIHTHGILYTVLFLLNTEPETYLDILESVHYSKYPEFGVKYTNIVMKSFSARILNNFEKYVHCIHFPTFAKYLNEDEIRKIVMEDFKMKSIEYFFTYDNIKHLIKQVIKDGKFRCLKDKLIDNIAENDCNDCILYNSIANMHWYSFKPYRLYEFAPFSEAFTELKKILRVESSPAERTTIIIFMLDCAGRDYNKLQHVLRYYHEKHMNEPLKYKIDFINCWLKKIKINVDEKDWNILNQLFHSMEVYTEFDNNTQHCVHAIVVHNAIVGEKNPDIIEQKFSFHTLKNYRSKLNLDEKEKVFEFLYNLCITKITEKEIVNNYDFAKVIHMVVNILNLFVDWEKELQCYPLILNKIKDLVTIKKNNGWNTSLEIFYNIKKSWRKYMFEESFVLNPSEEVCINALKHDTGLLSRNKDEIVNISQSKTLTRFLNKLRVHWPHSIMAEWINMYKESLKNISSHKYCIRGLMKSLPHEQLLDILKKYAPDHTKIDWNEQDASVLSIRKYIAKSMYLSRPLISVDMILLYAKGDYLQYTVPSLNSILHTLSSNQSYLGIPKLLKLPVSLQKYGIRFAVTKMAGHELMPLFLESWKSTKNVSIRSVLFIQTFRAMCKANNRVVAEEMLSLLCIFIHDLSAQENKNIYNTLGKVRNVPRHISGKFFRESYTILKSLPPKANCEVIVNRLLDYAPEIMELLDDNFVVNMLQDVVKTFKNECNVINVISSYLLCCNDEETQDKKFKAVLISLMDQDLPLLNGEYKNKKNIQNNFRILFRNLASQLKEHTLRKKQLVPSKLFLSIQTKLEELLLKPQNYVILTGWKIKVKFVILLEQHKSMLLTNIEDHADNSEDLIWNKILSIILPSYAKACYDILKQDTREFPNIIYIFDDIVKETLDALGYENRIEFLKYFLNVSSSSEDYVHVIYMCPSYLNNVELNSLKELHQLLHKLTPADVRVHYHHKFDDLLEIMRKE